MRTKEKPRPQEPSGPGPAVPLAVAAAVFFVFLPILKHQFVSWDDDVFLYRNLSFRGLGWTQLRWMFTTFHHGPYQPVVWLSYAVDHLLWGMDPAGFHLTGLLLHCANAALVFLVGRRLLGLARSEDDGPSLDLAAAAAALLFALHPLRVEPVAWAAARRDLMSGTFFLCALLSHLRARARPAFIFYCLSLLAKPMGIGLPLVLAVLDVHVLRRGPRWKEKLPYILPAAAAAALAWRGQAAAGATASAEVFGPLKRLAQAAYAHSFYLAKTAWPEGLAPMYERLLNFDPLGPRFLTAAAASLALAAAAYALRRRWSAFWASWLAYVVILAPVLGAVKYGSQLVADRYSYLPGLVLSLLAAGVLLRLMGRSPSRRRAVAAGACVVIIVLAGLTRRQLAYWRDSETLYLRILALDPGQTVARNNLGLVLAAKGRTEEALEQYRLALRLRPCYASAHNNLGAALLQSGRLDEAEAHFRRALACDPSCVTAARNRDIILRLRDGEGRRR